MAQDTFKIRNKQTGEILTIRRKGSAPEVKPQTALPQFNSVEQEIASRDGGRGLFQSGLNEIKETPGVLLSERGLFPVAKMVAAPFVEAGSRVEAALANPLMSIQQREPGGIPQAFKRMVQGVTGDRRGQFGDIFNRALPEDVAGIPTKPLGDSLGLATSVVAGNVASGGAVSKGLSKMERAVSRLRTAKNIKKSNTFYLKQASQIEDGVRQIENVISSQYDDLAKGLKNVDLSGESIGEVNQILKGLPDHTLNSIKRQTGLRLAGKASKNGPVQALPSNLKTVKELRTAVGKSIPKKVWKGIQEATPEQVRAMNAYDDLSDILAKNAGDLKDDMLALNAKFKKFSAHRQSIRRIIYNPDGNLKTTQLPNIFKETSEGTLDTIARFGEEFNQNVFDVLGNIKRFQRIQKIKKGAAKAAAIGGGTALIGDLFVRRPLRRATSGGFTSSSDGGN